MRTFCSVIYSLLAAILSSTDSTGGTILVFCPTASHLENQGSTVLGTKQERNKQPNNHQGRKPDQVHNDYSSRFHPRGGRSSKLPQQPGGRSTTILTNRGLTNIIIIIIIWSCQGKCLWRSNLARECHVGIQFVGPFLCRTSSWLFPKEQQQQQEQPL